MLNKWEIRQQCATSYGKNVRLKHLKKCLEMRTFPKAIEIGCGSGWLLHNVNADQKIGYDIEPEDVFDDIKYVKKDVKEIKESSVDLLICSEVIEHIKDDQSALNNFGDFVRGRGFIFLTTVNKNTKKDKSAQDKKHGHLRRYSSNLRGMIEQAGFKTLSFYPAKSSHYYNHKGHIEDYSCEEDTEEAIKGDASAWIYFGVKEKRKWIN